MKDLVANWLRTLAYYCSCLIPRRSDLWAFGCPESGFSDNPKYLFLWISANCPDIEVVWLTYSKKVYSELRTRGYRSELRGTWAARLVALRAGLHVFCHYSTDVYFPFCGGCLHINLWHGVGIKNVQYAVKSGPSAKIIKRAESPLFRLERLDLFRGPDMLLATSEMMAQHFSKCFRIPIERCPQIGYPRLDVMLDENLRLSALAFGDYACINEAFTNFDEVYIYMPTWRDTGRDFLADAFPDLPRFSRLLASRNALLYVKLHRHTTVNLPAEFANIQKWPDGLDIYPVLNCFNVLITDYSSILYDWIFMKDSGVVIYTFDYDSYTKIDHDLAFPFEENIVGVKADDFECLCAVIQTGAAMAPLPKEKLALLRERFWGEVGSLASPRLTAYLKHLASLK